MWTPDDEDTCRLLVDRVLDYAIFVLDPEGRVGSWNDGAELIKGYAPQEIIGQHMSRFYTPEDIERHLPETLLATARREGRVENEGWQLRKDGTRFWADVVITVLHDKTGKLRGFGKVTRDLTDRRRTEEALANASARLLEVHGEERRRVIRELHDSTSPLLTSLVGKLHSVRRRAENADPQLQAVVEEIAALTEATSNTIRRLVTMLHPPLLDESGLLESLHWYLNDLLRTGMHVEGRLGASFTRPSREAEVALFRLAQEWVPRLLQGGASNVVVGLVQTDREIDLTIEGVGLTWPRSWFSADRFRNEISVSLAASRERFQALGGDLTLQSHATATTIVARLPMSLR